LEAEEFCISALNIGSSIFDEQPLVTILRETTRAKVIPPEKVFLFILDSFCKELGNNAVVKVIQISLYQNNLDIFFKNSFS
jgi:hypothetical protein